MTMHQIHAAILADEVTRELAEERAREEAWLKNAVGQGSHIPVVNKSG